MPRPMVNHCMKCGGTPDLHNARSAVISVYNTRLGKWVEYPQHGFVYAGGNSNIDVR